jgi:hypothetical protein
MKTLAADIIEANGLAEILMPTEYINEATYVIE